MAGSRNNIASQVRQRIAGFFLGRTGQPPFIDPRMHSWARQLTSHSELPAQYRPFFQNREALPYCVLTPTFRGGYGRPEAERLLCIQEGRVHVLEAADGRLRCTSYRPENVAIIEYGVLLLHSWMTIHGQDESGTPQSVTIRFNSVSDYLMTPFLNCLRGAEQEGSGSALEMERAKLDYLAASHYKFRTYGRACVRSGAAVCQAILQPEIRRGRMMVLGISLSRLVSPAHLTVLTSSELINIRDDPGQRWARGSPHGAIWTYIPRSKIIGTTLTPRADGVQEFAVRVYEDRCLRWLFHSDNVPQLREAMDSLSC